MGGEGVRFTGRDLIALYEVSVAQASAQNRVVGRELDRPLGDEGSATLGDTIPGNSPDGEEEARKQELNERLAEQDLERIVAVVSAEQRVPPGDHTDFDLPLRLDELGYFRVSVAAPHLENQSAVRIGFGAHHAHAAPPPSPGQCHPEHECDRRNHESDADQRTEALRDDVRIAVPGSYVGVCH